MSFCDDDMNSGNAICLFDKVQRFPRIVCTTSPNKCPKENKLQLNPCVMIGTPDSACGFPNKK